MPWHVLNSFLGSPKAKEPRLHPLWQPLRPSRHSAKVRSSFHMMRQEVRSFCLRHTEDGCPKRFELGLREAPSHLPTSSIVRWNYHTEPPSSQAYAPTTAPLPTASATTSANRQRSYSLAVPSQSSGHHPQSPIQPLASSATFPLNYGSSRPEYASGMGATAFAA